MNKTWFGVLQLLSNVPREAEIGILVDGTRNETGDLVGFFVTREDVGEGGGERRCCLDGGKVDLANAVTIVRYFEICLRL
jgi:hypothetical protein